MKLKQSLLVVPAAFLLLALLQTTNATSTRGIRGTQSKKFDSPERKLKSSSKKSKKEKSKSKSKSSDGSSGQSPESRLDTPAQTPDPAPTNPTLSDWMDGCLAENANIIRCMPTQDNLCQNCLHALSFTSVTPSTANGSVNACRRNFCGDCGTEELMEFFDCGYVISNPIAEAEIPAETAIMDSSIRTPPPTNAIFATTIDENTDITNCPAMYPGSGIECIMLAGFEKKKCVYYEVGGVCDCSIDEPIWECAAIVATEEYVVETEDLEVDIEEEVEIAVLPSIDVVFSRMDPSEQNSDAFFCPIAAPISGDSCETNSFTSVECCYEAIEPYPNTLGTTTCTCSKDTGEFRCKGGSLSTCVLPSP